MTIKEARKTANLSQLSASLITGIPLKTLQHWEAYENNPESAGAREPGRGVKELVIDKILSSNQPKFKIKNQSIANYANICKKFAANTAEWGGLDENSFYTTSYSSWAETSDNAHGGVDVSWAFHLSSEEIEMCAAERLFELIMEQIELADSDGLDSESFAAIYEKFNF